MDPFLLFPECFELTHSNYSQMFGIVYLDSCVEHVVSRSGSSVDHHYIGLDAGDAQNPSFRGIFYKAFITSHPVVLWNTRPYSSRLTLFLHPSQPLSPLLPPKL